MYICLNLLFAETIKCLRKDRTLTQKQLAQDLEIVPIYRRIERSERPTKREQVIHLAKTLNYDKTELLELWIAEKAYNIVSEANGVLEVPSLVANNIE